jgi:hypothetical protein
MLFNIKLRITSFVDLKRVISLSISLFKYSISRIYAPFEFFSRKTSSKLDSI